MRKFFVTFGVNHPLYDHWIEVHASNEYEARSAIVDAFGRKWAMVYGSPDKLRGYFPGGRVGHVLRGR